MDPIHPLAPVSQQPAPVGAVRRVPRDGERREREDGRRERPRAPIAEPPAPAGPAPDGHLDARV
jgi:hypothetical protein